VNPSIIVGMAPFYKNYPQVGVYDASQKTRYCLFAYHVDVCYFVPQVCVYLTDRQTDNHTPWRSTQAAQKRFEWRPGRDLASARAFECLPHKQIFAKF